MIMATDRQHRSTAEWEQLVGGQLRAARIVRGWDQSYLSDLAGVSTGALKNLESGRGSSLRTVVKVLRALDRTDWLESLAPQVTISPLRMLRDQRRTVRPQRVSRPRRPPTSDEA
jgi:transcriptional regulator with XRE-family HTH domain